MRRKTFLLLVILFGGGTRAASAQADLAAWAFSGEQLISAVRITTSQLSTSGQVNAANEQQTRQAFASALTSQMGGHLAMRARAVHGANTGQGYGVCATPIAMASRSIAERSGIRVDAAFGATDNAWLTNGGDALARAGYLQAARRSFYCTDEERAATGWCTAAGRRGIPAGDTNAAVFMRPDLGPEEALTAADFIDTVAPLPTIEANVRNLEQAQARADSRRRGAMMTASRQTMFSVVNGAMGGDGADK